MLPTPEAADPAHKMRPQVECSSLEASLAQAVEVVLARKRAVRLEDLIVFAWHFRATPHKVEAPDLAQGDLDDKTLGRKLLLGRSPIPSGQ